jgi:hypothetical protein
MGAVSLCRPSSRPQALLLSRGCSETQFLSLRLALYSLARVGAMQSRGYPALRDSRDGLPKDRDFTASSPAVFSPPARSWLHPVQSSGYSCWAVGTGANWRKG